MFAWKTSTFPCKGTVLRPPPQRNFAFSCKSIILLIVSRSPKKLCVHSKNICISLKKVLHSLTEVFCSPEKFCVHSRKYYSPEKLCIHLRNLRSLAKVLRSPEKFCVHFYNVHKIFAREHNVSQGNKNVFQENPNFLGGMKTFCAKRSVNAKTLKNYFSYHLKIPRPQSPCPFMGSVL